MKFWSLPKNKVHMIEEICENGEYFGQTKKDGNWYQFSKAADGTPYLFSRGINYEDRVTSRRNREFLILPKLLKSCQITQLF